jgi:predicted glutamine amidotransferase
LVLECSVSKEGKTIDLTVVCVHNRSLNDIDVKDFVRQKRFLQAEDIAGFVNSILEENPNANIVVTGDFNGYQFTDGYVDVLGIITGNLDPEGAMVEGEDLIEIDLRNQIYSLPFEYRYSYVHNGNSSAIDHMLTSFNLNKYVTEISYARGNADSPESYEDIEDTPLRSSDHDGLVMYLALTSENETQTALPLAELMANGFAETTYCNSYLVNSSGEDTIFTLTEIDSENNVLSASTHSLNKGEKVLISSLTQSQEYANLTVNTNDNLTLFSETITDTGQMTAYINLDLANTRFIPHIAEQTEQWDSFLFLSSPEMADTTLDVASNSTVFHGNYSFFENCEQYLDTSSGSVDYATAYGTLTSSSNSISGFEIFKKAGNDGAATELISKGSKTIYIPHIPTETDIFWTGLAFLNPTDTEIASTVTLYDSNGEVSYTYSFTTPPHTKLVNVIEGIFPGIDTNSQWGVVQSNGELIGIELYGTYSAGICGFSLNGNALCDGIIPFIYKGEGLWTGVAFANPDIETAKVFVRLTGKDGSVKEEKSFEIGAKKRVAFVVDSYFNSDLIESTDTITYYSEKPVVAIEASGDLDRTFMTALSASLYKY